MEYEICLSDTITEKGQMSGIETAVIAAVGNTVTKEAIDWVRSRGDDFSEGDWKQAAEPVLRQVRATHEQFRTARYDKAQRGQLKKEIRVSGRILRELEYVGQHRGFDPDTIERYSELADLMAEWYKSPEIELEDEAGPCAERFEKMYLEYKEFK